MTPPAVPLSFPFVIPFRVRQTTVSIWVALLNPRRLSRGQSTLVLAEAQNGPELSRVDITSELNVFPISREFFWRMYYTVHEFTNLTPDTPYKCNLINERDTSLIECFFETLPQGLVLASGQDRGFTVLLGSCFSYQDDNGEVGRAARELYLHRRYRPHLKFLVGDQVYADQNPLTIYNGVEHFLSLGLSNAGNEKIREEIATRYLSSWVKLNDMLRHGGNVCLSDDHEFWNDYPFKPLKIWIALQNDKLRRRVKGQTKNFFKVIQLGKDVDQIDIGNQLSIFVMDTRINRTETKFVLEAHMDAFEQWITNLTCPGIFVLGQPLLWNDIGIVGDRIPSEANWVSAGVGLVVGGLPGALVGWLAGDQADDLAEEIVGEISDHNLMFYKEQFRRLTTLLANAKHDIAVLSGDIHFGRIARMRIHHKDGSDPTKIFEVISSPMSVLSTAKATVLQHLSEQNPRIFPAPAEKRYFYEDGVYSANAYAAAVEYVRFVPTQDMQQSQNHFMSLEFTSGMEPGSVHVTVRAWLTGKRDRSRRLPKEAWAYSFDLDTGRLPSDGSISRRSVTQVVKTYPWQRGDGVIAALANPLETWSPRLVREVIYDIENNLAEYFTDPSQGSNARIHVVHDTVNNIKYLRTNADSNSPNNLDNLPVIDATEWHH